MNLLNPSPTPSGPGPAPPVRRPPAVPAAAVPAAAVPAPRSGRTHPADGRAASDPGGEASEVLTIAISSRALFDLEESHRVFDREGVEAYARYQVARENELLGAGPAFGAVRKLLALNELAPARRRVDVVLLSRNSVDAGLRVLHSIAWHGLDIQRAAFASGVERYRYLGAFGAQLFLSADGDAVRKAIHAGYAAATLLPASGEDGHGRGARRCGDGLRQPADRELRIAFDGGRGALLGHGGASIPHPRSRDVRPHRAGGGPRAAAGRTVSRVPGCLAPATGGVRAGAGLADPDRPRDGSLRPGPHERVVRTLRAWGIRIDEALFLGGLEKREFLQAFGADIFFDDQRCHCDAARGVAAIGHVPSGVANEGS